MLSLYKKDEKILIVGPYPPPLGGISVHTKRLFFLLKTNNFHSNLYRLNNLSIPGLQWVKFILHLIFNNYDVIHFQVFEPFFYTIILLFCKWKKVRVILTIHNPKSNYNPKRISKLLNKTDVIVLVGNHIEEKYKEQGINIFTEKKVIPSYLPPNENEEKIILETYPKELINFIQSKKKLLLVSAYKLILNDGIDLYGIDKSIELITKIKHEEISVGLIIAIADDKFNKEYLSKLQQLIIQNKLSDNVYLLLNQKEIWPLFKKINLFLRPTLYDGFGISVAEAISMGCKAIASDVCERAEGTVLYNYADDNDLYLKAKKVLFEL